MKRYHLSAIDLSQYSCLTEEEKQAWLHPRHDSYHSLHVERMGSNTFRWRDSRESFYYVGTAAELAEYALTMQLRKIDPNYEHHMQNIRPLTQEEINDLLSEL